MNFWHPKKKKNSHPPLSKHPYPWFAAGCIRGAGAEPGVDHTGAGRVAGGAGAGGTVGVDAPGADPDRLPPRPSRATADNAGPVKEAGPTGACERSPRLSLGINPGVNRREQQGVGGTASPERFVAGGNARVAERTSDSERTARLAGVVHHDGQRQGKRRGGEHRRGEGCPVTARVRLNVAPSAENSTLPFVVVDVHACK